MLWWLVSVSVSLAAEPWTLEGARTQAETQAIAVEQAMAARDAAKADAWSATAGALPSVVAFAGVGVGTGLTEFGFERPTQTQLSAGFQGSWALLSPSDWAASRVARRGLEGQEAMALWAQVEARRAVTAAYAAALGAVAQQAALARAASDAAESAAAVGSEAAAGIRPPADAALADAAAATAAANRLAAEWGVTARCAELQALLREEIGPACVLAPTAWEAPEEGPGAHPALAAAEAALAGAEASVAGAVAVSLPSVSADATAAWYVVDSAAGPGWAASVDLTVPLMASGAGAAALRSADAAKRTAALALEDQERQLRAALAGAEARHRAARDTLAARQTALAAAEVALMRLSERYDAGLASLTALLDTRRLRDAAAVALALSEAEVGIALAELEAARGIW